MSASLPDTKPGNIVAASFLITNKTDREEEFSEALSLPANWQAVNPPTTFLTLVPQEQRVRIIAFLVPAGTAAATYDVTYSVRSQRDYGIQDTDTVQVAILPVSKNVLVVEEKPDAVIAGDEYRVTARLVNQGNSEAGVSL
ncbi:MAG: hypothetical protein A2Z18_08080 [Armatimonadetes bacterium RBG_16_58_9]|nr:MAG: hypothetical protein A2Z18_08080 [Armatimonadetes bacterium RBG_16_58_9]